MVKIGVGARGMGVGVGVRWITVIGAIRARLATQTPNQISKADECYNAQRYSDSTSDCNSVVGVGRNTLKSRGIPAIIRVAVAAERILADGAVGVGN